MLAVAGQNKMQNDDDEHGQKYISLALSSGIWSRLVTDVIRKL